MQTKRLITELNQSYNDLGEDLLLLEAVVLASLGENEFPREYIESSLQRVKDYIEQHTQEIWRIAVPLADSIPLTGRQPESVAHQATR